MWEHDRGCVPVCKLHGGGRLFHLSLDQLVLAVEGGDPVVQ